MIDPQNITDFNRSEKRLQEFLLFAIVVAGKNSKIQAKKLQKFLQPAFRHKVLPLDYIKRLHQNKQLRSRLEKFKMGQYNRILKAFVQLAKIDIDLQKISIEDLESIHGIGMKSARFFVLHSRYGVECACIDTHILKWFSSKGFKVPKATPRKNQYLALQKIFINKAKKLNITCAALDLMIWKKYNKGSKTLQKAA